MSEVLFANHSAYERHAVAETYYGSLGRHERLVASRISKQITSTGPLADTVVVIPVAAHQEAAQIDHTMAQYAAQKTDAPFSVVLGLNCPRDKQYHPDTQATLNEVDAAMQCYPGLDIRTSFRAYKKPIIGQIRRDLWNGVLASAIENEQLGHDRTVIGLNQDIDLEQLWPGSLHAIQSSYASLASYNAFMPVTGMYMRHGISPDHPNIARSLSWHDFTVRQTGGTFDAALAVPLEMYAFAGGFNETSLGEVFGRLKGPQYLHRGAYATTSPRRYLERIHRDGMHVWGHGKFSANDAYRVRDDFPDISEARAHQLMRNSLPQAAASIGSYVITGVLDALNQIRVSDPDMYELAVIKGAFLEYIYEKTITRKQLAGSRALTLLSGSNELADIFTKRMPMDIARMAGQMREVLEAASSDEDPTVDFTIDML